MAGVAAAENIHVVIEGDDDNVRHDPTTGTTEIDQPDGGVIIQFNSADPNAQDDEDLSAPELEKFYANLTPDMGEGELSNIGEMLFEAVSADDSSRKGTLENYTRGLDLLGLELRDPQSSVGGDSSAALDGMSTVTNPLMLEACLKGWASAQAELLPAEGPCKIDDVSLKQNAQEKELADALELGMNTYLTVIAKEYVPDTSQMLLWGTYFRGSGFKKVYRCPLRRRPASDSVPAQHLIVSDTTKDLGACERITHEIPMRQTTMKRMVLAGVYRDPSLPPPSGGDTDEVTQAIADIQGTDPRVDRPEDQPYKIWEIQCELDLAKFAPGKFKGKGIALPYLVTIDKETHTVLAIRRDWKPEDEECERKRMYVRYPYIPGPGFYGTGLLNILGNSTAAMTAAWREALDAGMYANFPSFLINKLAGRQNTSDFRAAPAQGIPVDLNGMKIQDAIMAMPYKDVTPGLLGLIDKITEQSKGVGGAVEIPVGEGTQNIPVGTMLAMIEQATKVMAAAHKGMHTAQSDELQMIADLFREDPEAFWRWNKKQPGFWDEQKLLTALKMFTLIPKSDPNVPSQVHRIQEAVALVQLCDSPSMGPLLNKQEVLTEVLTVMRRDPQRFIAPPPPAADPANNPALIEARAKQTAAEGKVLDAHAKMGSNEVRAADVAQKGKIADQALRAEGDSNSVDMAKTILKTGADRHDADRSHGLDVAKHRLNVADTTHRAALDTYVATKPEPPAAS